MAKFGGFVLLCDIYNKVYRSCLEKFVPSTDIITIQKDF